MVGLIAQGNCDGSRITVNMGERDLGFEYGLAGTPGRTAVPLGAGSSLDIVAEGGGWAKLNKAPRQTVRVCENSISA